jgi:hypothetical protein
LRLILGVPILADMSLKSAACFAIAGTAAWTVLTAVNLIRSISGVAGGFAAPITLLNTGILFVAALSLLVFFVVFRKGQ